MKKEVLINIKGIQHADGEDEVTELFTHGTYHKHNNNYYITYTESETTGFDGCKTALKVEDSKRVTLTRYGDLPSQLIIEDGERNIGHYRTIAGDMTVGVTARKVNSKLTDNGGELYLCYSLDVNSSFIGENEVFVTIKED